MMIKKRFLEKQEDQKRGFFPQYPVESSAWVWHPKADPEHPSFLKFQIRFTISDATTPLRFHVSGDQYFKLFIDGELVCKGPENSDVLHWSFSSFEWETPEPGEHEITAFAWNAGPDAPLCRMSYSGGFIFAAEGAYAEQLNTGIAPWQVEKLDLHLTPYVSCTWQFYAAGQDSIWKGNGFATAGDAVVPVAIVQDIIEPARHGVRQKGWLFRPAVLPELTAAHIAPGRFVALKPNEPDSKNIVFKTKDADPERLAPWNKLLSGQPITVPAHTEIALLWDMEEYYCGFSELKTSGGHNSQVSWRWIESLYNNEPGKEKERCHRTKGHRDEWVDKLACGTGDVFSPSGKTDCYFSYWWRAGRFCLIKIKTEDEPLEIRSMHIEENLYPVTDESSVHLDLPGSDALVRICKRGLLSTLQDQYCDSPYFEQTQYAGDSRIEALLTYMMSRDDRVPRRMIDHFDWSRSLFNGIPSCRYPASKEAILETFSLIYILILHDAMRWRPSQKLIQDKRPAIHKILHYFLGKKNDQGLSVGFIFPYMDDGTVYDRGMASESQTAPSAPINLFLLLALQKASEIEEVAGFPGRRDSFSREADKLGQNIRNVFFCSDQGVFADDPAHQHFSQHAQCLAVLAGLLEGETARAALKRSMDDVTFNPTSLYFRFYFFQALFRCGLEHRFVENLQDWQNMVNLGLKAPAEHPNLQTTRSDCHAWGSHPLFFFLTEIAGIQPAEPGFHRVSIRPRWIDSRSLQATMPHPEGLITVDFELTQETCRGRIELPLGTSGVFEYANQKLSLKGGVNILT